MLLEVKNLLVKYGEATAVREVSLHIEEGEVVAILGANGAGKTSIIRAISGLTQVAKGEIWFDGKRVDRLPAHKIAQLGIAQIPAGRQIFSPMTVLENLKLGASQRRDRAKIKQDLEATFEHFPILKERQSQLGGSLSGGEQQMLAVARALMSSPKLLLMDEPSVGLAPIMVAEIGRIVGDINARGLSILLVEQNSRMALKLSSRAYVLELGKVALSGDCDTLADDEEVRKCYLGAV
jgi:branched-chain amino acid transport system ATP-binding protein